MDSSGMSIHRIVIRINKIKNKNGKIKEIPIFGYRIHPSNSKCSTQDINRIKKLCIPPNWKDVRISNSEISHLQAIGKDDKNRTQYIYHPMWIFLTSSEKYKRMGDFSRKMAVFEKKIKKDLECLEPIGIMFRILQKTHIRVGNDCYAKDNGTYGLTSLQKRHINIKNKKINLSFVGKKGVPQSVNFSDPFCLKYLTHKLKNIKSKDSVFNISPNTLNKYLQSVTGENFTCKDFRTYASNILFLKILCKYDIPKTEKESKENLKNTYKLVADKLGHTSAISKKSYVMGIIPNQYLLNPAQFCHKNPKVIFNRLVS